MGSVILMTTTCPSWCGLHAEKDIDTDFDDLHMSQWVWVDGVGDDYIEVVVEQAISTEAATSCRLETDTPHIVLKTDEDAAYDVHLSPGRARTLGNVLRHMAEATEYPAVPS